MFYRVARFHLQLFASLTPTVDLGHPQTNSPFNKDFVAAEGPELHGTMELKNKNKQKKNAGKQNLQCKIGFRKTHQFFCPPLLSKLVSGQSANFL